MSGKDRFITRLRRHAGIVGRIEFFWGNELGKGRMEMRLLDGTGRYIEGGTDETVAVAEGKGTAGTLEDLVAEALRGSERIEKAEFSRTNAVFLISATPL